MTTMAMPRMLISGVPRSPAPYGLFTAVTIRENQDGHWQGGGVEWEHLPCRQLGQVGEPDCEPSDSTGGTPGLPKDFSDSGPAGSEASPFTVYAPWECSPVGYTLEDAQAQATSLLLAGEQYALERAVWSGALGNEPNLTDAVPAAEGPLSPLDALATLEAAFAGQVGSQGVIHASRWAATVLAKDADVAASGSRLLTPLGSVVIAGSGYGVEERRNRIYMTPPAFVYRSEIFTSSDRAGDLLDRRTNDLYAIAERTYLVGWDDCPTSAYVDVEYGTS